MKFAIQMEPETLLGHTVTHIMSRIYIHNYVYKNVFHNLLWYTLLILLNILCIYDYVYRNVFHSLLWYIRFAPCQSTEFSFIYQSMVWSVGSSLDVQNNFMWKSCFRAHVATSSAHLAVIGSICARPIFWPCHQGVWSISASFSSPNEGSEALGRFSSSSAIHLSRRCKHLLVCGIEVPISSLNLFD